MAWGWRWTDKKARKQQSEQDTGQNAKANV
jgi:hypothetical protein